MAEEGTEVVEAASTEAAEAASTAVVAGVIFPGADIFQVEG